MRPAASPPISMSKKTVSVTLGPLAAASAGRAAPAKRRKQTVAATKTPAPTPSVRAILRLMNDDDDAEAAEDDAASPTRTERR